VSAILQILFNVADFFGIAYDKGLKHLGGYDLVVGHRFKLGGKGYQPGSDLVRERLQLPLLDALVHALKC